MRRLKKIASKYNDSSAVIQVIGNVFNNPSLLDDDDKYNITDEDFASEFHRVIFGSIYKIHELGAKETDLKTISDYFESHPKSGAIYRQQKGEEWLIKASKSATPLAFDYYYDRLKKMTLLRVYDSYGIDVSDIYDPDNILDMKKKQTQEELLDNCTLVDIADKISDKVELIKAQYVDEIQNTHAQAGENIFDLIESFKVCPEVGIPLYGPLINTVTRGARLKKFYLRSAATGVGKTRSMIADACFIACDMIYDDLLGWIKTGPNNPTLFVTTEQEISEIQTMMLAFISNVNEDKILNGNYTGDEEARVYKAGEILSRAPLYVEELPDFNLNDIENTIKRNIRDHDVLYVFHDYIHTSLKILEEITKRAGGVRLREDNILFMLSNRLKDLCNQYGIFIMSATQLNGSFKDSDSPDQTLLRGAKSIADKVDYGSIILSVTQRDIEALDSVLSKNAFDVPILKISVYKNRRGKYKGIYLWCKADLGTCRIIPMFCTDYNYGLVQIDDLTVEVE